MYEYYSPTSFFDSVSSENSAVIICVSSQTSQGIKRNLLRHGYIYGNNVFCYDDFVANYYSDIAIYEFGKLILPTITFSVTTVCTLKCEKCSFKIPHHKNKYHRDLYDVQRDMEIFFSSVDFVEELNILGGEPLLYEKLPQLIVWMQKNFSDKYRRARITSNGTVQVTDDLIYAMKSTGTCLEQSEYGELSKAISYNRLKCEINGVTNWLLCYKTWQDMGLSGNKISNNGDRYWDCETTCRAVMDGKLIFCLPGYYSSVAMCFPNDNGSLDLKGRKKKEIYAYYNGLNTKYPAYCDYCNGFGLAKKIPVAVQIR